MANRSKRNDDQSKTYKRLPDQDISVTYLFIEANNFDVIHLIL